MNSLKYFNEKANDYHVVAAGSLVTKGTRIPDGSLVMGSPARIRRSLTEQEKEDLSRNADEYLALSEKLSYK